MFSPLQYVKIIHPHDIRPCGLMDKAPDFGSGDCRFEFYQGRSFTYCLPVRSSLYVAETREGWTLLTVWNWGKWGLMEYKWKGPFLGYFIGLVVPVRFLSCLGCSSRPSSNIFLLTGHYSITLQLSPSTSKLGRQSCCAAWFFMWAFQDQLLTMAAIGTCNTLHEEPALTFLAWFRWYRCFVYILCTGDPYYVLYTALLIS